MHKILLASTLALAALFTAGEAQAGPCRSFERTFYDYGRATYQSGTECLNRWGDWEVVSMNNYGGNNFFGPAAPAQVVYVDRQPVYTPTYSINLGYLDIDRRGGGRHYKRDWDRHDHRDHGRGHGRGHDRH